MHARSTKGCDFTAMLPAEVLVLVLEIGRFTHVELAQLRLVNRALCSAASAPSLYRVLVTKAADAEALQRLPSFVADSVRVVPRCTPWLTHLGALSDLLPSLTSRQNWRGQPGRPPATPAPPVSHR